MTTLRNDMMLTGRAARALRGACWFGVLALVAVALSAGAPSSERAAKLAEDKAILERLAAVNLDRMNRAMAMTAGRPEALGGEVSIKGAATMHIPPRIVTADRSYSVSPMRPFPEHVGVAPEIFHDDANPVQVGDEPRRYPLYLTGLYIESTQR